VSSIDALAIDVDGVLTDNTFLWGPNGEELKRFSFADVMGISRARQKGVVFALISGEASPLVTRFADKMGIVHVFMGCKDKASAFRTFTETVGVPLARAGFVGNDINDVGAMAIAGVAAAPADAHASARRCARIVTQAKGGEGAVREVLDLLVLEPDGSAASKGAP
jgi:3-deoxy-D-manno-octulosonate 8-phosphate phosphatase (KDO 8-P phosphatase)